MPKLTQYPGGTASVGSVLTNRRKDMLETSATVAPSSPSRSRLRIMAVP